MTQITYLKGDATNPIAKGNKIIAHICNDVGGWGKGFVLAISRKWKEPEKAYRKWYKDKNGFELGEVQLIPVTDYISICNMIGQKGIKTGSTGVPIRYEAVESCLEKLSKIAKEQQASIHMPRIGCGLAGGKWEIIEPIIRKTLIEDGIEVYIYDFD
ncbi:macro domain-containing protein [Listeria monocytogenes]|uniref:Appr-1-p processing protein n=1 Tax=Listeria monocytogenes TaxID=1639 RepID=A0A823J3T5_LISMN|nr:macro domain-containing protein [Listeria monocytogenes]EAC7884373.1 Appr-1-p processing protein [Listeria monocytogenes]EAE5921550.1 Appr-1-p processing protein [Listeria monocytogenes]EAF8226541.1 Appr-1-p processing protein [Listeria monocytogenes]EAG6687161.1 Appr-1-p processing protein [Listeria monocytogenes]EAG9221692.1 Appr-1-p processing protein [Listeria monocytogenes]